MTADGTSRAKICPSVSPDVVKAITGPTPGRCGRPRPSPASSAHTCPITAVTSCRSSWSRLIFGVQNIIIMKMTFGGYRWLQLKAPLAFSGPRGFQCKALRPHNTGEGGHERSTRWQTQNTASTDRALAITIALQIYSSQKCWKISLLQAFFLISTLQATEPLSPQTDLSLSRAPAGPGAPRSHCSALRGANAPTCSRHFLEC